MFFSPLFILYQLTLHSHPPLNVSLSCLAIFLFVKILRKTLFDVELVCWFSNVTSFDTGVCSDLFQSQDHIVLFFICLTQRYQHFNSSFSYSFYQSLLGVFLFDNCTGALFSRLYLEYITLLQIFYHYIVLVVKEFNTTFLSYFNLICLYLTYS